MKHGIPLLALTAVWGLSFVVIRWCLDDAGFVTLTCLRMVSGLAALLLLARPRLRAATALELRAGALAGAALTGAYLLQTEGLVTADAGKSGFLTTFYVPLVPLFEAAVFRRLPAGRDVAAVGLAFLGITLIAVDPGALSISPGEALVALSALCWAAQIVIVGRVADRADPLRLAAIQLAVVAAATGALLPFAGEPPVRWSWGFAGGVLFLGPVVCALAFAVQAWGQRVVTPTRAAVLFSPEPVFAALFGAWLLGERLAAKDLAGSALVLGAVGVTLLARARTQPGAPAAARSSG